MTLNCVHSLLQKLQHEQFLKEDAQTEHKRLRTEAQTFEQTLSRLRKEIEVKERDIATLRIKGRQEVDRHSEELTVMVRDKDALQKHCNNLTRRQVQFQHEIRRKELQYEWLQEKLRNYLAERKRESSASMEIVGLLRQQSPQQPKDRNKITSKIDDMMPGRHGNAKRSANRGPKLDETMVKMIVTAYEEKQKELMAENDDLQEALNSIRKEYTDLMNAQMEKAEAQSKSLSRMDSKIYTTKRDSLDSHHGSEETRISPFPPGPSKSSTSASQALPEASITSTPVLDKPHLATRSHERSGTLTEIHEQDYEGPPDEDIRRMAELPDGVLNADHPDLVPWPIQHEVQLRQTGVETEEDANKAQAILDTGEHAPVLPTVSEEQEIADSVKGTPRKATEEEEPLDAVQLAEQTNVVLTSLTGALEEQSFPETLKEVKKMPDAEIEKEKMSPEKKKTARKPPPEELSSPESGSPFTGRSKTGKYVWPPPSQSPQPREEPSQRPMRPALGKLPQPSNKPVPNAALLSEEQLKAELRTRAVDVEEAVRALKTACTSMQPQHMRSVLEKRLHMELTMAANLAEQQEAVVNLALAGLEKVRRTAPGTEMELEEMSLTVIASLNKSESLVTRMMQMVSTPDADKETQLQVHLEEIKKELQELREKATSRPHPGARDTPLSTCSSQEVERSISSLRERADGLTKEKESIRKARGDLSEEKVNQSSIPSRRTWAAKAKEDKESKETYDGAPDIYSDDESTPKETLSHILHSTD